MNAPVIQPTVSPRAQALAVYIAQSVKQLAQAASSRQGTDALLFLGNWHDAIPRLLWRDPILEAIDVRVWGILMTCAHAQNATAFPSYDEIARLAHVARGTVARAMLILRATRWLSVCGRLHDPQGRYRGNIYALHDEPVTLADAIHLDPSYMQFLHQATRHHHPRVRKVAKAVLSTIQDDIAADHDVTEDIHSPMERRLAAWQFTEKDTAATQTPPHPLSRFYSISRRRLAGLSEAKPTADRSVQNLNSEPVQILNSVGEDEKISENHEDKPLVQNLNSLCSSSLNKTTTTTNQRPEAEPTSPGGELHFPPHLTASERTLSQMYLEALDADQRQAVLDELHGRMRSVETGGQPMRNPIGYLATLCGAVKSNTFQPTSLGLRVREARERHEALAREEVRRDEHFTKQTLEQPAPSNPWVKHIQAIKDKKAAKDGQAHAR